MFLRRAILLSVFVHVGVLVAAETYFTVQGVNTVEVAVSQGAPVVVMAYSPPVENPFEVPFELAVVEELVEVSLEAPREVTIDGKPIATEPPPTDRVAETVKVATPAMTPAAETSEVPKHVGRDDVTAAPLERKQTRAERQPDLPPPPIPSPAKRALATPPPVRSQPIAVAMRTPTPFNSSAPAGASVDQFPRQAPNNPAPNYPREALAAGIEGRVMLRVTIEADGAVGAARVSTSSGSASLDDAALAAIRSWRFEPARRGGEAVPYEVIVPIRFAIRRQ